MKGFRNAGLSEEIHGPGASSRDLPVSSRRDALARLRKNISQGGSEVALLTGEPGTGKTWLWRRLVQELPANWRWLSVDMSEALDALEFLRLIGHGLGIKAGDRLGAVRLELARALQDDSSDGRSWLLVVENAQNASSQVWNEIQALAHAMEASEGFTALVLVGPTELTRLLGTRRLTALATRMRTHVHLLSLDLDESLELAKSRGDLQNPDRSSLEELHRDSRGNPRRLLQLLGNGIWATAAPAVTSQPAALPRLPEPPAQPVAARSGTTAEPVSRAIPAPDRGPVASALESPATAQQSRPPAAAPLVPSRPPLRVEEGLIEVGWGGSLEAEEAVSAGDSIEPTVAVPPACEEGELPSEEMIEDHYAALQAWTEWAKNRGRASSPNAPAASDQAVREQMADATTGTALEEQDTEEAFVPPGLRAELQHDHAPYSQLFSRLRQSK